MKYGALILALLALFACGKKESDSDTPAGDNTETETGDKPATEASDAAKPVELDPAMQALFDEGKDCAINDNGVVICDVADKIRELTFQRQNDDKLAAGCAAALKDKDARIRTLAAKCMDGFTDGTLTPFLAVGLDAVEAETDPKVRRVMAWSFGSGNAKEAGVEDRVIALVRKYAADKETDPIASSLMGSLFPSYLMQATAAPSKAAGDLALEMAGKTGWQVQGRALEAVSMLSDRAGEACKLLAEIAATDEWPAAVASLASLGDACAEQLDPIVDKIAKELGEGRMNTSHYSSTRQLISRTTLSDEQVKKLLKGAKARAKKETKAKSVWAKGANEIVDKLKNYQPPAPKN